MKWTHYPTEKDRKDKTNGTQLTGSVWSDAPPPGGQWVLPDGWPNKARSLIIVTTRAASHDGKPFSEGPLPEREGGPADDHQR